MFWCYFCYVCHSRRYFTVLLGYMLCGTVISNTYYEHGDSTSFISGAKFSPPSNPSPLHPRGFATDHQAVCVSEASVTRGKNNYGHCSHYIRVLICSELPQVCLICPHTARVPYKSPASSRRGYRPVAIKRCRDRGRSGAGLSHQPPAIAACDSFAAAAAEAVFSPTACFSRRSLSASLAQTCTA